MAAKLLGNGPEQLRNRKETELNPVLTMRSDELRAAADAILKQLENNPDYKAANAEFEQAIENTRPTPEDIIGSLQR